MAPKQNERVVVSLTQFAKGGSAIDDVDVEIADAKWAEWDYNGNIPEPVLALAIQYQDADGETHDQYYSAGDLKYFVPSDDGTWIQPVGDKQLLNDNSNCAKYLMSLAECGMPSEVLDSGDITGIVGTKCHVQNVPQPVRQGLIRGGKNPDKAPTILLVTQIMELPGAAPAKKVAGKVGGAKAAPARPTQAAPVGRVAAGATTKTSPSKVNGKAAPAPAGEDPLAETAVDVLRTVMSEADGGTLTKKALNTAVFREATKRVSAGDLDKNDKQKLVQMLYEDSFLHAQAEAEVIVYDGGTLSLPE